MGDRVGGEPHGPQTRVPSMPNEDIPLPLYGPVIF